MCQMPIFFLPLVYLFLQLLVFLLDAFVVLAKVINDNMLLGERLSQLFILLLFICQEIKVAYDAQNLPYTNLLAELNFKKKKKKPTEPCDKQQPKHLVQFLHTSFLLHLLEELFFDLFNMLNEILYT